MSVERKKKPSVWELEEAVLKNTAAPDAVEIKKLLTSKRIRTSVKGEGNGEVGLILFVGIGSDWKLTEDEIMSALSLERSELESMLKNYKSLKKENKRFMNKIKLINNYLRLVYGIRK